MNKIKQLRKEKKLSETVWSKLSRKELVSLEAIGKICHLLIYNHGTKQSEKRGNNQNGKKGIPHEAIVQPRG